jgi:hypothetical protein
MLTSPRFVSTIHCVASLNFIAFTELSTLSNLSNLFVRLPVAGRGRMINECRCSHIFLSLVVRLLLS